MTERAPKLPKPARQKRISKRLGRAIELYASGRAITRAAAAQAAGMTPEGFYKALKKVHVKAFLTRRTAEILELGKIKAAERLVELIDGNSASAAFDASKLILALGGIAPPERPTIINNGGIVAGYVVDLGQFDLGGGDEQGPIIDLVPEDEPDEPSSD